MYRLFVFTLILLSILLGGSQAPLIRAQEPGAVEVLLKSLTVAERVGQLFIVPFVGENVSPDSDITTLITQYKVGGVVLQSSNDNFKNSLSTPKEIALLANSLQGHTLANKNIPLFVAVDHEGDGWPYTRITGGVTPLPSQMSIGATWNPENARAVGNIVGRELSAMGINLLLGPVLDVLNDPRPTGRGDVGIRTFGGDPYWVGHLGKAYIQGVHEGGNHTIATVAKHFPGHGGSDRLPDYEVATVDKSLQELRRIELAPFFEVTNIMSFEERNTSEPIPGSTVTDAMMSSHIRYRGLQGDIRRFTAPISFDQTGMETLLKLPEFSAWREQGGLIVSDALGVPAVRKYYDPTLQSFPHNQIALEAFLAGNDVLILSQFDLNSIWSQQFENIKDTVLFFQEKYQADSDFARRVDQSVERVLRLKLKLFPNASPNALFVDGEVALAASGQGQAIVDRIAEESLTLIYPTLDEYKRQVPRPPLPQEKILIVSDVRQVKECFQADCEPFSPLGYTDLETVLLDQYGPQATGQVIPENVNSISFAELKQVLVGALVEANQPLTDFGLRSADEVRTLIREADWIIFAMLDLDTKRFSSSNALKRFLEEGLDTIDKNLIVFSFSSPYYLDTTEISKLVAYFGLYSKTKPHLEVAMRALFEAVSFPGMPPVSVEAIGYDLPNVLAPDPIRSFPLQVQRVDNTDFRSPVFVTVEAGPILDHNGNPVPDDTPVEIDIRYGTDPFDNVAIAHTVNGQIEVTINLTLPGLVEITARSGAAQSQRPQIVSVVLLDTATATRSQPITPTNTVTVPPTNTLMPTSIVNTATPLPTASATPTSMLVPTLPTRFVTATPQKMTISDLLTTLFGIIVTSLLGLFLRRTSTSANSSKTRVCLIAFVAGMIAYLLYGLGWLRPDLWLIPDAAQSLKRLMLGGLVIIFGLGSYVIERYSWRRS